MEVKPMENSAPPKPQGGGKGPGSKNIVVSAYYNFHKNEILADADRMGIDAMRKKWSIPSGTWTGLKRRWNVTASPKPAAKVQYELVEKSGPIIILLQAMSDRLSALKTQIEEINIGASIFIPTDIEEEVIAAMITAKPHSQTNTDLAKRILRVVKAMEGV
jgi:hypothetical protein